MTHFCLMWTSLLTLTRSAGSWQNFPAKWSYLIQKNSNSQKPLGNSLDLLLMTLEYSPHLSSSNLSWTFQHHEILQMWDLDLDLSVGSAFLSPRPQRCSYFGTCCPSKLLSRKVWNLDANLSTFQVNFVVPDCLSRRSDTPLPTIFLPITAPTDMLELNHKWQMNSTPLPTLPLKKSKWEKYAANPISQGGGYLMRLNGGISSF